MRLRHSPRSFFVHFPGPRGYDVATTPRTSHQSPRSAPAPSGAAGYVVATAAERQPAGACFFVTDDGLQLYTKGNMLHRGWVCCGLDSGALRRYDWNMIAHSPISASAAGTDRRALARDAQWAERMAALKQECEESESLADAALDQARIAARSGGLAARLAVRLAEFPAEGTGESTFEWAWVVIVLEEWARRPDGLTRDEAMAQGWAVLKQSRMRPRSEQAQKQLKLEMLEIEKEWGPAPEAADLDPQDEAEFSQRASAGLAKSEKSLALRQTLRRADAAALPQITAHQIARRRIRTTTLARIARARISALMHARLRVAHACISARAMRAGRAAAAHKRGRRLLLAV